MNAIPDMTLTDTASLDWFTAILKAEGLFDEASSSLTKCTNVANQQGQFLSFDTIWRSSRQLKSTDRLVRK